MKRGWQTVALDELGEMKGGGTPSRTIPEYFEGDIPWITGADVTDFYVKTARSFITKKAIENSATSLLPAKSVLVVSRTGVGKVGVAAMPLCVSQDLTGIICNDRVLPEYLARCLLANSAVLTTAAQGSTILGITREYLRQVRIPLPPVSEQERIVEVLDEADALRQRRAQADRRTAEFIPALFHEMFGDPGKNPMRWPIVPVSSFVKEFQGGQSILTDGTETPDTKYRVLKVSAVTWKHYQPEESKPVPPEYKPPNNHIVRPGDLLFSRANTVALVAATVYVFDTPPNRLLSDKTWRFVWREPRSVEPLFVWSLFQHPSVRAELSVRATGTGGSMKNISKPKVLSLPVPMPPVSLQREFAERVAEVCGRWRRRRPKAASVWMPCSPPCSTAHSKVSCEANPIIAPCAGLLRQARIHSRGSGRSHSHQFLAARRVGSDGMQPELSLQRGLEWKGVCDQARAPDLCRGSDGDCRGDSLHVLFLSGEQL
jgi:type I restriction enzyme, S subunit